MTTCKDCIHERACTEMLKAQGYEISADYKGNADRCDTFKNKADVVEVVRCKDCKHCHQLAPHSELNHTAYWHCGLWRGEETKNVWHKYKKYYADYSLVEANDYCSYGERRENNAE